MSGTEAASESTAPVANRAATRSATVPAANSAPTHGTAPDSSHHRTERRRATHAGYKITSARIVGSELYKLSTLRSTWWFLGINAVLIIGGSAGMAFVMRTLISANAGVKVFYENGTEVRVYTSVALQWQSLISLASLSIVLMALFASIAFTSEYSTSSIQSTLAAAPRRVSVFMAKGLTVAFLSFLSSLIGTLIAWGISTAVFAQAHLEPLSAGEGIKMALIVLLGVPFAIGLSAFIGTGIGAMVRSTGISILCTLGFVHIPRTLRCSLRLRSGSVLVGAHGDVVLLHGLRREFRGRRSAIHHHRVAHIP